MPSQFNYLRRWFEQLPFGHSARDVARVETAKAPGRGNRVIPTPVDGALPGPEQIPGRQRRLGDLSAIGVGDKSFDQDADVLLGAVKKDMAEEAERWFHNNPRQNR